MSSFDLQSLEKLLYDFYNLTNIKACLYDAEENELCFYPTRLSAFCEILRRDEKIDARCRACDKHAFAHCRNTRVQHVYTCHAGLQECVSPIICDNRIVGFIMIGQIKNESEYNFENLREELPEELKESLRAAYRGLPRISDEKLLSAFRILDACASYELLKTLAHLGENPIDAQIDAYIRQNLALPLSVSDLCSQFHLSRYEIYHICNEYFCCSPAEYIKKCRLTHARKLLTTTSRRVNQIAIECGIPDYNYFSKIFKSTYGVSPTAYRKSEKSPTASR